MIRNMKYFSKLKCVGTIWNIKGQSCYDRAEQQMNLLTSSFFTYSDKKFIRESTSWKKLCFYYEVTVVKSKYFWQGTKRLVSRHIIQIKQWRQSIIAVSTSIIFTLYKLSTLNFSSRMRLFLKLIFVIFFLV